MDSRNRRTTKSLAGIASAIALAAAPGTFAADAAPAADGHSKLLLTLSHPAKGHGQLTVTSPSYADGGAIPWENTQYRGNVFPGVNWTAGPAGTQSYVVVMQGMNPKGTATSVHFTLFNIPPGVTRLNPGLSSPPNGALYGVNVHGFNQPYSGPHAHTPAIQTYFLEVLALDTELKSDPKLSFAALEAGIHGHVLASGAVSGTTFRDPTAPPDPPRQ
jgi:para-nitrobenzyl esterase